MELESPRRTLLLVDTNLFELKLYKRPLLSSRYRIHSQYDIAVGQIGYDTPTGVYAIRHKAKCPEWLVPDSQWAIEAGLKPGIIIPGCTQENPLKKRWLGITDPKEGIGIHGTGDINSLGSRASHGCIRMNPDDIVKLYPLVPKGTPIVIFGEK